MRNKLYEIVLSAYTKFKVFKWGLGSYLKSEKGATAVEYALVIAVVVVLVIGATMVMSEPLEKFFKAAIAKVQAIVTPKE